MKQFGKILKFELKYYLTNKVFIGVTAFLMVLIAVVMFIPRIGMLFNAEEESGVEITTDGESGIVEVTTAYPPMLVKADDAEQADLVQEVFSAFFTEYDVQVTNEDLDTIKAQITAGDAECAFVMTGPASFTYYVENLSMYDMNTDIAVSVLQQIYQMNAMLETGMTESQVMDVMSIQVDVQVESLGVNQADNFLYTYIMIMALYMLILL